jgi:hypothetical protein
MYETSIGGYIRMVVTIIVLFKMLLGHWVLAWVYSCRQMPAVIPTERDLLERVSFASPTLQVRQISSQKSTVSRNITGAKSSLQKHQH